MSTQPKKILLTGVTGLVGARLLRRLVEAGLDCRVLVRRAQDAPAGVPAIVGDLLDPNSLTAAVQGVSDIIHLAAVFRTPDTNLIWQSNLEGTRCLLAAMQAHAPAARFILASTSNVYSPDQAHPGREDDAVAPALAYPASKVAAEQELASARQQRPDLRSGVAAVAPVVPGERGAGGCGGHDAAPISSRPEAVRSACPVSVVTAISPAAARR